MPQPRSRSTTTTSTASVTSISSAKSERRSEPGPIEVRWMKGRSRPYALGDAAKARSALSIALHERCDMIVATAALTGDQPAVQEPTVVEFLNSEVVLRWAEVTLGL